MTPSAFIFLYENQLFLTFRNQAVVVRNIRGKLDVLYAASSSQGHPKLSVTYEEMEKALETHGLFREHYQMMRN